jgi:hypothetical protein
MLETFTIKSNYNRTLYSIAFIVIFTFIITFLVDYVSLRETIFASCKAVLFFGLLGFIWHLEHYYVFIIEGNNIVLKHYIIGTKIIPLNILREVKVTHKIIFRGGYQPSFVFRFKDGSEKKILMYQPKEKDINNMLAYLETRNIQVEIGNSNPNY